jgi:orotidine-5'-phosphate decarboxylase
MNKQQLIQTIKDKNSFLCIGLDSDITKIPKHLLQLEDPVFEFNKAIIDATNQYCVSYKINTAFYESNGLVGWQSMLKTIAYIPKNIFIIADAKRGDIGNTSTQYAKAFFEQMKCHAITVAPYMGKDSISPFLAYTNHFTIILALTSNEGAADYQYYTQNDIPLYKHVLQTTSKWGTDQNTMYVIGATKASALAEVRELVPNHFLLIPGVGAQGGSLEEVYKYGANKDIGILVNVSRGIIFKDNTENFAQSAADEAAYYQQSMQALLNQ